MPKQDDPRCETCGHFVKDREYTGLCTLEGGERDIKDGCWWHTDLEKEKGEH